MLRSDQGCRSTRKVIGINQTPNQPSFQSTSSMQATQNSVYEKNFLYVAVQVIQYYVLLTLKDRKTLS